MVLPLRDATSVTVSPPFSTMYSTPSVPTASSSTPPSVWLYRMAATLAGTATMSSSPCTSCGVSSLALAAMVNAYPFSVAPLSASSSSFTMPMEVGPFSPPNRTVTGWAADLSPSSMGIGVFGVTQAHSVNASASASSRDIIFFMLFSPFRDTVSYTKLSCSMPICLLSV